MAKKKKAKRHHAAKTTSTKPNAVVEFVNKHPHFLPLMILFTLLLIFFNEVLFGGKTLLPPDQLNSLSAGPFQKDALSRGIYPLWCPYLFGGMPSFASLLSAPFVDIINNVFWLAKKVLPIPDFTRILFNYFLFGLFTYIFLMRKTGVSLAALFAAIAIAFQPPVIAFAAFGHNTKLGTIALLPLIFLLLDELLEKRQIRYFALLALSVGIQMLRAHTQMVYYSFMVLGLYILFWTVDSVIQKKPAGQILKPISLVLVALILGVAMSAWLYIPVQEYTQYSIRGGAKGLDYGYATGWSFSPKEMMTFLVPSFVGFGGQTYWGDMPFTDYPHYMGIVTLFLAGFALVLNRNRTVIFFVVVVVTALFISFGNNFSILYDLVFKLLPFFNKFRVPSMILILVQFSMVVLAALGLNALLNLKDESYRQKVKKYVYVFVGICGIITLFLLLSKSTYMGWISGSAKNLSLSARDTAYQNAVSDSVKMLLLIAACGFLVVYHLNDRMKNNAFAAAIIALVVIDLWWVDFKIINPQPKVNKDSYFAETEAVKFLKAQNEPFRIYPVVDDKPGNWYMYHKIQNIKGYHAAKIKSYQSFLENTGLEVRNRFGLPPFVSKYLDVVVKDGQPTLQEVPAERIPPERFSMDNAIIDMMNVKYLISYYPIPDERFKLVVNNRPLVYENTKVLPRAFFVDSVNVIEQEADFYTLLKSGKFDPSKVAVLEEEPDFEIIPSQDNKVEITSYDIHEINLKTEVAEPALLVLSEIYYPAGWKALVDGQQAKIYKTNAILRSIFLEPGNHEIQLIFESKSLTIGLWISFTSLFLALGFLLYDWKFKAKTTSEKA